MMYLLISINIVLLLLGQVIWKLGTKTINFEMNLKGIFNFILNPYVLGGGIIYVIASIVWIYILSKEDLSKVYPLQSLCYVFGAIIGVFIFNENMSALRILGLFLIFCGAFIISLS
ncbi:EamA family transporter [Clostridium tertium]|uniref:EamA family transporter n=1 Tax=Clostridium tertium TaxID=1559 RepID=A0A9X3XGC6_9CLOT|nr:MULTISPECIES: EamA family transporter [Clostridium]EEH97192.1 hypothetical protein CSBG_00818 [Clostridium sp. 7_2_43FAA]MBU6134729.1 EamA family transporter [Clostridium tertium]MDB1923109.1 EamA family transporter [Clostridium tertium]MDB1926749.1 EamA family transporter [Clostridium tertium]MDB1930178.1 EamA family transporter [Clostridium tertium]